MKKKKIGILGLGGVGGFIGAPLAKAYANDPLVEIIFICRGITKETIDKEGLTLESVNGTYNVKPDVVSDDPEAIGTLDALIVATKSYGLIQALNSYEACISADTLIVTQQNMVNAKETILKNISINQDQIVEGCIYVASNIKSPGYIKHLGGPGTVHIGGDKQHEWIANLLQQGGVDTTFYAAIKPVLWKKFLFLSPSAAVTAAYNVTFGQLAQNEELMNLFESLMQEVQSLASKYGVNLKDEDTQAAIQLIKTLPLQSKSSFQLDVEKNPQKTEKAFLIDFMVENGAQLGVDVQNYQKVSSKINALVVI
ncbi:hypothetical protein BKI52_10250 [marine bacterium AO1-C]|nr:hypothetical protein BKI52_10250 [marine bacterium AO1-C]